MQLLAGSTGFLGTLFQHFSVVKQTDRHDLPKYANNPAYPNQVLVLKPNETTVMLSRDNTGALSQETPVTAVVVQIYGNHASGIKRSSITVYTSKDGDRFGPGLQALENFRLTAESDGKGDKIQVSSPDQCGDSVKDGHSPEAPISLPTIARELQAMGWTPSSEKRGIKAFSPRLLRLLRDRVMRY